MKKLPGSRQDRYLYWYCKWNWNYWL